MIETQLKAFYQTYIRAFAQLDISLVKQCYQLPATLTTPERVVLLADDAIFEQEFAAIFATLASNNISGFKTSNASYSLISNELVLANIDWQFIDKANNLFAEFSAIYHLTFSAGSFKIINVNSVDTRQSLSLINPLVISTEN